MAAMLAAAGRRLHFPAGALIQQQGDASDGFWLIEAGEVMACRHSETGELTIYAVFGPGDLFGDLACFAGVPRQVDAIAEGACTLVRIDGALIDRLLEDRPDFARWLLKSLANQLRTALDRIEGDRTLPAEARIARALSDMAERSGPDLAITQQALADFVGVSRVTAGQVLSQFEADGRVKRGYRQIEVIDSVALAEIGQH